MYALFPKEYSSIYPDMECINKDSDVCKPKEFKGIEMSISKRIKAFLKLNPTTIGKVKRDKNLRELINETVYFPNILMLPVERNSITNCEMKDILCSIIAYTEVNDVVLSNTLSTYISERIEYTCENIYSLPQLIRVQAIYMEIIDGVKRIGVKNKLRCENRVEEVLAEHVYRSR